MIEIKNLTKYYGNILGAKAVSLKINKGEVFGFIGPNGAGKSTTIRCILGFLKPNSGQIFIDGKEIMFNDFKYKEDIGYLPGEIDLYGDLTVKEMLDYSASFYKKECKKNINSLVKLFKVDLKKKIDTLSLGNKKKVGIIIALMHDPKILILDEPTSGLDPIMQNNLFDVLDNLKKKGTTIFFSTHVLNEVKRICDRVAIIKDGEVVQTSEVDDITHSDIITVEIISDEYKKLKLPMKDIIIKEKANDKISFIYKGNINDLIQIISNIEIKNITIENPSIEELFMHYYK